MTPTAKPWLDDGDVRLYHGDAAEVLRALPAETVQTCITSPPYYGLRDYGTAQWTGGDPGCQHYQGRKGAGRADGIVDERGQRNRDGGAALTSGICSGCGASRIDSQLGLEPTPDEYVAALVETFREVRRVLRDDGTLWLNLGDSYNAYNGNRGASGGLSARADQARNATERGLTFPGLKNKDLIGIPWRVAFALQADGWYLRSDIIWAKPNPMPESVTDRPTKAHEYVFLLSKGPRYYYDADAVREPHETADDPRNRADFRPRRLEADASIVNGGARRTTRGASTWPEGGRNRRSVWTVATQPYPGAHFATFPPKLIEPCVLAGAPEGGTVLDPFSGSGTTALVARNHQRRAIGIDLSEDYLRLSADRLSQLSLLGDAAR